MVYNKTIQKLFSNFTKPRTLKTLFFLAGVIVGYVLGVIHPLRFFVRLVGVRWLIELLGTPINYHNYLNPPIYFSVGEAVAAVGLLFAAYQLKQPHWRIAFDVRWKTARGISFLVIGAFASVIMATIMAHIIKSSSVTIWQVPVFWEILGGLLFVLAPVLLLRAARPKGLFGDDKSMRLFSVLMREAASNNPANLDAVVDVLKENLGTILANLRQPHYERKTKDFSNKELLAHLIVTRVISEPTLTDYVMVSRTDFLEQFISEVNRLGIHGYHSIGIAFGSLIKSGFDIEKSYFYREMNFVGRGIDQSILRHLFEDQRFLNGVRPFDQFSLPYGEQLNLAKVKLFVKCLELALRGYLRRPAVYYSGGYPHIHWGFEKLIEVTSKIITSHKELGLDHWYLINGLGAVGHFLGNYFIWEYVNVHKESDITIPDADKRVLVERKSYGLYPLSMTFDYVNCLYKFLCEISHLPDGDSMRSYALTSTSEVLSLQNVSPELRMIQSRLLELIWKQIRANVDKGHYPAVLPVYLCTVDMWQDSVGSEQKKRYNQTIKFLDNTLKPLILSEAKMANDKLMEEVLLPTCIKFNREKDIFEHHMRHGVQDMMIRSVD